MAAQTRIAPAVPAPPAAAAAVPSLASADGKAPAAPPPAETVTKVEVDVAPEYATAICTLDRCHGGRRGPYGPFEQVAVAGQLVAVFGLAPEEAAEIVGYLELPDSAAA
eukprot:SAG22_NODE_8_length_37215_cov_120.960351_27_plen_109_part_00